MLSGGDRSARPAPAGAEELELRPAQAADLEDLLAFTARVFGRAGARSRAEWLWAYRSLVAPEGAEDPTAGRTWIALRRGRIVAHLGARPVRTLWAGEERRLVQLTDACADPTALRGLGRRTPFVALARALLEDARGRGEAIAFSWPLEGARRVAEERLGFRAVREEWVLVGACAALGALEAPERNVDRSPPLDGSVLRLWERCADDHDAGAVRDAAYLVRRYHTRPSVRYEALGVGDGEGGLAALAVLRVTPWEFSEAVPVVEWLVPLEEREAALVLLRACGRRAAALGAAELALSVPEHSPWFERLVRLGLLVHPAPHPLVALALDPAVDAELMGTGWWHGLGDSELV